MTRTVPIPVLVSVAALASLAVAGAAAGGIDGWSVLALGFVIGMAHALEADHLAAVAAMVDRDGNRRAVIARGAAWGLGHTVALFVICSLVILLGLTISDRIEAGLELIVGVMIAGLGLRVLWRLYRDRVHFHVHEHDGERHLHAHSHKSAPKGVHPRAHDHAHVPMRAHLGTLGVGLVHGAAGSAGLLVLTVATRDSLAGAMLYFAVFGIGSLAGMAALTTLISYPLAWIERGAGWLRASTSIATAALALWIGGVLAYESLETVALAAF